MSCALADVKTLNPAIKATPNMTDPNTVFMLHIPVFMGWLTLNPEVRDVVTITQVNKSNDPSR